MSDKKNKLIGFTLGVIVGAMFFGSVALAASSETRALSAIFRGIRIEIDQTQFIPNDVHGNEVEPFIVDGTTYLPIRAIAEAFDKEVLWDGDANTVRIFTKSEPVTEAEIETAFIEVYLSDGTLQEFKINNIELYDLEFLRNIWTIEYSVLPKDGHSEWIAGNGEFGENGWIVNKSLFAYAVKTDGIVSLRVI
jgi:hypothetical protein